MASTPSTQRSSLQTPVFLGNNYEYWSLTMKALFRGQYVWEIVQDGYTKPIDRRTYNHLTQGEKDFLKEHRKKDAKAVHEIILLRVATKNAAK